MNGSDRGTAMEVKVGALILASLALLVGFVLLLGDFRCSDNAVLYMDVPTSGNLKTGAPVKVSGVTVGQVARVDLWGGQRDPEHGGRPVQVRVTLKVRGDVPGMLHEDARFFITTLGALGEKYVEVDPGSPDRAVLASGAVVEGVGPMRLELLGQDAGTIARELSALLRENREEVRTTIRTGRELMASAAAILAENRDDLRATLSAARETLQNLARVSRALAEAAGDGADLKRIVASARAVAEKVETAVAPALDRIPGVLDRVGQTLDEAAGLLAEGRPKVMATLDHVEHLARSARDGKGSLGALLSDREMYDDLVELLKDIKRNPWKLFMKP